MTCTCYFAQQSVSMLVYQFNMVRADVFSSCLGLLLLVPSTQAHVNFVVRNCLHGACASLVKKQFFIQAIDTSNKSIELVYQQHRNTCCAK